MPCHVTIIVVCMSACAASCAANRPDSTVSQFAKLSESLSRTTDEDTVGCGYISSEVQNITSGIQLVPILDEPCE